MVGGDVMGAARRDKGVGEGSLKEGKGGKRSRRGVTTCKKGREGKKGRACGRERSNNGNGRRTVDMRAYWL